ncbi:MAG: NB-ARC domain-containing protein, partial [Chloroflexi bacterium]|nr:NB-ARC domain-containing protein [Chloroflexota bacterium]
PGGVGKTRLALRVADQVKDQFADGVYFVPLSTLTDPALVLPTLAQTLQVRETGQLLLDSLKAYLHNKHMLLVRDNVEQVIAAVPQIKELLSASPQLKILATSRTSLHIREEKELPVPPLGLPDCVGKLDVACLLQAPAVQLFVQRVQEVKPDFVLKADNAAMVAEICQRLDGLPLALELAAARLKIFSPAKLLAHLEQPLDTLVGGARDLPDRQQTLRNTIEWSYNLLEQPAKVLLRRLTIFARSWTLEDAEQVCNNAGDLGSDMLDELEMLVDNNLLKRADGPDGEPRFTMLHTIRIYARQQLVASGEEPLMQQRHAAYLIQLAEAAEPFLTSGQRSEYLARLEAMLEDVRLALRWCRATASEVETGLRLAGAFNWFWYLRGYVREGREWLEQLLAQATPSLANSVYQAEARFGAGALACTQGDLVIARQQLAASRTIYAAIGDQRALANVMTFQGIVALSQGELASARELCTASAAQFHALGDIWSEAFALNWLGEITFVAGHEAEARTHCEKSLALFRQIGDSWGTAMPLHVLANMAWVGSDYAAAHDLFAESGALLHEAGDQWGYARSLAGSAAAALHQKNYTQAKSVFQVVLPLWEELGNQIGLISCLIGLAEVFSAEDQSARAIKILSNADMLLRKNGFTTDGVQSTGGILLDTVDLHQFQRTLTLARAKLIEAQFTAAWSQGQEMTLDQIMGEAVEGQGCTAEELVSI